MKFKDLLLEMPVNMGDITDLPARHRDLSSTLEYLESQNPKKHKMFDSLTYGVLEQYFIVYQGSKIIFYIRFSKRKKTMVIDVVENLSKIKGLQFKVLSFILEKLKFTEIETGDALSTANIKSHIKYVLNRNFNLYLRKNKIDIKIETEDDINREMKNSSFNSTFVLKTSNVNEALSRMYNSNFSEIYDDLSITSGITL